MLSAYASCAIVLAVSATLGYAIRVLCGTHRWTWTAPAVGFAGLLVIVDATIRLPGGGWTSLGFVAALSAISIWLIRRKGLGIEIRSLVLTAGPVVIVVTALASSSYLINRNFGIPGVSLLNDFAGHLPWATALAKHQSPFELIIPGYPVGSFALAGTLGQVPGISVLAGFQGLLIATPVLLAVTTLALFEHLRVALRVMATTVVALAYLLTAALVEGAFKEPVEALLLVAIALVLQEVTEGREQRARAVALPIAVLMAGSVANYSYPGLSWPLLLVVLWVPLELLRRGRTISRQAMAGALAAALVGAVVLVVLSLPEIVRFHAFQQAQVATINMQTGNVPTSLPWREALGIWFSDDFRLWQTQSLNLQHALLVFAIAVSGFGAIQAWRRRELSLLALLGAAIALAVYTRHTANAYNAAKAMMVLSGAVVLVSMRGVLPTGTAETRQDDEHRRAGGRPRLAGVLVAVAFAAACLWSDGLALRGSRVGPSDHAQELARLDRLLAGHTVLFLGQDDFAAWELRHTRLAYLTLYVIPSPPVPFRAERPFVLGQPADFGTVTPKGLDAFRYVVTTRSAYASVPPPNWRPVAATPSYQAWARTGPTGPYSITATGSAPGVALDCSTAAGRRLRRTPGTALVTARPFVLDGDGWQGPLLGVQPGYSALRAGTAVTQQVTLPPGRWQVSLQYMSSTALTVRMQGLNAELPAVLEHQGPYWPAGDISSTGRPQTIEVDVHAPPFPATARTSVLGNVAFVRRDVAPATVPLRAACGRYVNWMTLRRARRATAQ
ncbi:MAG TPA: hypothetical protein VKB03_02470 [Conexibacter sp.]|nr:hypothetical protein [Conexibacter sp.]